MESKKTSDCGVLEEEFPIVGECFNKRLTVSGTVYDKHCIYCSIWSSLPTGENLIITHIFECSLYGYCKRIKE